MRAVTCDDNDEAEVAALIGMGCEDDKEVVTCFPVEVRLVAKPKFDFGLLQPAAMACNVGKFV